MSEKKTPAIRFQGFTDDWEDHKLGKMVNFSKGRGYSKSDIKASGTPIILYGRLYTKYETVISNIDTFADEKTNSVFSDGGEVIVPASGETAEDISVASVVGQSGVLLGGDLNIITPSSELDSTFLAISISNGKPHRDMAKMAQGKSVVHLHNSDLAKIDLPYPNYEEQCKISQHFKTIDTLITLHQCKLTKLQLLKKSMLTKMFPKDGARVPEIRFQGFHGDWEQHQFRDVGSVAMCKRVFKDETSDKGDIPFFKIGTFGGNPDAYISRELFDEYKSKYPYPEIGDILLSASGTIGRQVEYKGEDAYYQDSNIIWLKHGKILSNKFLKVVYQVIKWNGVEGSTIQRLYNDNILKTRFFLPSLEEQEAIGDYFYNLDNLISLQKDRFAKLQKIK